MADLKKRSRRVYPYQEERYHTYSDERLQELYNKEGNIEAFGVLEDRKIVRELVTNPKTEFLDHQVPLGPRIWLLFKKPRSIVNRVTMWLKLEENVTQEDVKHYWWEIEQWQALLLEWGGPKKSTKPRDAYLASLYEKYTQEGFSTGQLVEVVASHALHQLDFLLYLHTKYEDFTQSLKRIDLWSEEETKRWENNFGAALQWFRMAGGHDEAELREWLKDALKHLMSNYTTPIKAPVPVTPLQIEGAFKTFRSRFIKAGKGSGKNTLIPSVHNTTFIG